MVTPPMSMVPSPSSVMSAGMTWIHSGRRYSRQMCSWQKGISSPEASRAAMASGVQAHWAISRSRASVFLEARVKPFTAQRPKLWSQCQWVRMVISGMDSRWSVMAV